MRPMTRRIFDWLIAVVAFSPLVLMAWYPDIFTAGLRFVLRYHLELVLLAWIHAYSLWVVYSRRNNRRGRLAFGILGGDNHPVRYSDNHLGRW